MVEGWYPVAVILESKTVLPPLRAWQRDSVVLAGLEDDVEDPGEVSIIIVSQPLYCAPSPALSGLDEEVEGSVASCSVSGISVASRVDEVVMMPVITRHDGGWHSLFM